LIIKHKASYKIPAFFLIFLLAVSLPAQAEESEYDFDVSEFEKKAYDFGGFAGLTPAAMLADDKAALYRLKYFRQSGRPELVESLELELMLEGSYRAGNGTLKGRLDSFLNYDGQTWDDRVVLQEAFLSVQDSPSLVANVGKKVLKWGKGYAFNPVAFVDRPKDPNDPELALEGFYVAQFDYIRSFQGPLTTLAITPVFVPTLGTMNEELGDENGANAALKFYFLLWDSDIDIMGMAGQSVAPRYGLDISRNIVSNLEVHGDAAYLHDRKKTVLTSEGELKDREQDAAVALLGLRYLAPTNTTFIVEYYFNGAGYDKEQAEVFYSFVEDAFEAYEKTENDKPMKLAGRASRGGYGQPYSLKNYGFLRASHPEPFNVVYLSLALTGMVNFEDGGFSAFPEVGYTGVKNFEFRFKAGAQYGSQDSEFGSKVADYRAGLRVRYFF
jgi:hypothetical protein